MKIVFLTLVIGLRLVSALSAAQVGSSLTESDSERNAVKLEREAVSAEMRALRGKLTAAETSIARLQANLAIANGEGEVFRRQAGELKLRLEALGIDSASANSGKLEQRLLRAASDFKYVDDERKALKDALIQLSETVLAFQKKATSPDADARLALEVEMRSAAKALGVASPDSVTAHAAGATLGDGMVISIKDEYALVVANFGSSQGVKIGMPFRVMRGSETIGNVQVVDVREKIAGAVVQNLSSGQERIKVGDRLVVDAKK